MRTFHLKKSAQFVNARLNQGSKMLWLLLAIILFHPLYNFSRLKMSFQCGARQK